MASLNEIAYNVLNAVSGGKSTNNDTISDRQIKYLIRQYRAMLLRRTASGTAEDRRGAVGLGVRLTEFEQDIDLNFKLVPRSEQGTLGTAIFDTPLLRSTIWLSPPVRLRRGPAFTYIGTADDGTHFHFINIARVNYMRGGQFTQNKPYSFYANRYLYIVNPSDQHIYTHDSRQFLYRVRGIFENPALVFEQAGYTYTDDFDPYPVPLDFSEQLTKAIIQGEVSMMRRSPDDLVLNLHDDSTTTSS